MAPDADDAVGNRNIGQADTGRKCIISYTGDAIRNYHASQTNTYIERANSDIGHISPDHNVGHATAVLERIFTDACDAVGDCVVSTSTQGIFDKHGLALIEQDTAQAAKGGITCVHYKRAKAGTLYERILTNAGYAAAEQNVRKAGAVSERIYCDGGDAVRNYDTGQLDAVLEGRHSDGDEVSANRYVGQTGAILEHTSSDGGNAVQNYDAGHTGLPSKRHVSDASHWEAISHAGDDHHTAGTSVLRYGDRAVIDRVIELGLHYGGQCQ